MTQTSLLKTFWGSLWKRRPTETEVPVEEVRAAPVADAAPPETPRSSNEVPPAAPDSEAGQAPSENVSSVYFAHVTSSDIDHSLIDVDAMKVVSRLHQFGHQAFLVGGCVRDLLLGKTPKDFDIATSAHPGEVRATFRNCRLIGRRFRLAHVYFKGGKVIEVSTFRANPADVEDPTSIEPRGASEESNSDDSDPSDDLFITHDNVFGTAEQDARRRDFTINGLFYDLASGKVIDYVKGQRDLQLRQIRTIGDPEIRMREDPVRLLRAVRFSCKLDLDIEPRTYAAMEGAVEDLPRCSAPRLLEETFRLLRGGCAGPALKLLDALDALKVLVPPLHDYVRQSSPDQVLEFFEFAAAIDRKTEEAGQPLPDAVILAALLFPLCKKERPGPSEKETSLVTEQVDALLNEFVQSARLPRKIAERCRALIIAQKTLRGERRRRGSLASFRTHPVFEDAMTLFDISVQATGLYKEEFEVWKTGKAPQPKPHAEGPSRRRRRRKRPNPSARPPEA